MNQKDIPWHVLMHSINKKGFYYGRFDTWNDFYGYIKK